MIYEFMTIAFSVLIGWIMAELIIKICKKYMTEAAGEILDGIDDRLANIEAELYWTQHAIRRQAEIERMEEEELLNEINDERGDSSE